MKYRLKDQGEIEAFQFVGRDNVPEWMRNAIASGTVQVETIVVSKFPHLVNTQALIIRRDFYAQLCRIGDYAELKQCGSIDFWDKAVFESKYEPVFSLRARTYDVEVPR